MPLPTPSVSRAAITALVTCLLGIHMWLALSATIDQGFTADETAHLTAGYSYWRFNDYRLQPENGNLPQRWGALPLLVQKPHLDPQEIPDLWSRSHVWRISQHFLFESGNNTDFLLLCAHATMLFWSVATGLLIFFWAHRLWGAFGALFSLSLFTFSPTVLAHAPLVTSDMCAAFWLLAATGAWWRVTRRIDLLNLLMSTSALSFAAVAKFSCVLLLPIGGAIVVWRVLSPEPLAVAPARIFPTRLPKLAALLALAGAHVVIAWIVVWAFFGFRYEAFAPELPLAAKFFVSWPDVMPSDGIWQWFFTFARDQRILPEAYLQGFAYVLDAAQQRGAFLAGNFSSTGWWWFFPYAALVKSSVAESLALVVVVGMAAKRLVRASSAVIVADVSRVLPLIVFAAVYGGFSLGSHLNIGQRHILPLYPVLFILSGALARRTLGWRGVSIALLVALLAAGEVIQARPHFLAFFNRPSGGPVLGWRHLVDSSLDWGQNLPRLSGWLRENRRPGEKVYLSMFGSDDPSYHGIDAQELAPYYSFGRQRQWVELEPGLYCISATMLQDVYSPFSGPWTSEREAIYRKLLRMMREELVRGARTPDLGEFGEGPEQALWNLDRARFARLCLYLRERNPDAVIGHTIFVYRLAAPEVRVVVEGSFTELATAISTAEHAPD